MPIYSNSFVERIAFPVKPDGDTRRALIAAGFRFKGFYWEKPLTQTFTLNPKMLADILTPMVKDQPDMAAG